MNNLVTKAVELIYQMDNDQLNQVIDAVKLKRQYLSKQATRSLVIGDNVNFTSTRTGKNLTGEVVKIARKYITVRCPGEGLWRVPGNMLERV